MQIHPVPDGRHGKVLANQQNRHIASVSHCQPIKRGEWTVPQSCMRGLTQLDIVHVQIGAQTPGDRRHGGWPRSKTTRHVIRLDLVFAIDSDLLPKSTEMKDSPTSHGWS